MDLNATAVELAEITLWLDTMVAGLRAPWFGLHLRRGNSLIGARRAVYTKAQVNDKSWLKSTPADVPLTGLAEEMTNGTTARQSDGRIHHFLLPAAGWGSATEAKEACALAPDAAKALREWRRSITAKPTRKQVDALVELAHRVESLWQLTLRRLQLAEQEARRHIPLWGRDERPHAQAVGREEIEQKLGNPDGAYQRLRRIMDAWAALWFWPLTGTDGVQAPQPGRVDRGLPGDPRPRPGSPPSAQRPHRPATALGWDDLDAAEDLNLSFAAAAPSTRSSRPTPGSRVCEQVAASKASSTGNSTSPRSSHAAASTFS